MRIYVRVTARASLEKVEKIDENQYKVWLKKSPVKGEANKALISILADYFDVPKSAVEIIAGKTARDKMIEIKG